MQTWNLLIRGIYVVKRWWLLMLLAGLGSGATAYYLLRSQPSQYVAKASLMVGTNLLDPDPREDASGVSAILAAFYADVARRSVITEAVVEKLELPIAPEALAEFMLTTRVVPQSQLVEIQVLDTNPERAAKIATTVADELINYSPTAPDKIEEQRQFTQGQIANLQGEINQLEQKIVELNGQIQNMTSAGEIAEASQRLREIELLKAQKQSTYEGLIGTLNDSTVNSLRLFEPALVPTFSLARRTFPATALATILGVCIGLAAAWILDELDDVWRRGRKVELMVGEPTLGVVRVDHLGMTGETALQTPRGRDCLALRSELLLRMERGAPPSVMVTSARAAAERSRLSLDLAQLFARSGQRVLLVDANMGEDFLADSLGIEGDAVQSLLREPQQPIDPLIKPTEQEYLKVLPGNAGGPSAHLVPTLHWPRAVQAVSGAAELTIFDGPPVLESADATLLAPHVGGVVLVIDPSGERCSETRRALARLHEIGAPLLGVVMLNHPKQPIWRMLGARRRRIQPAGVTG